jgi:tryptophan synthase beta subunit
MTLARQLGPSAILLVNLSGRGDKDVEAGQKCLD